MVTETFACPHCQQAEPVVRYGRNDSGTARLWCKDCRKAFTPRPRSRTLSADTAAQIEAALHERLSQRAIARMLQVSRDTIRQVRKKTGGAQLRALESLVPALRGDSLEVDELVVRFGQRRRYLYLWVVIARCTRQVLTFYLSDRSFKSLADLWDWVPKDYRRKLVYSDFYGIYGEFFRPWQHRPSAKGSGRTSVIEGLNNKWRNRVPGLVRRTVCVQHKQDLEERLWLVIAQHNQQSQRRAEKLGWIESSTR